MGKHTSPDGRLYLDTFGDSGRSASSLPDFGACLVWIAGSSEETETVFAAVRTALGVRQNYEFHARKLTKRERSTQFSRTFFEQLLVSGLRFEGWVAHMRKSRSKLPPQLAGVALVRELTAQAILRMPREQVVGYTLTIDEQDVGKKVSPIARNLRKHINDQLAARGHDYTLGRVVPRPAHQCAGLQLADFVGAAVAEPWIECLAVFRPGQIHSWMT